MFFLGSAKACDDLAPLMNPSSANAFIFGDTCVVLYDSTTKFAASKWLIDSGDTHHYTHNAAAILKSSTSLVRVRVANGSALQAISN